MFKLCRHAQNVSFISTIIADEEEKRKQGWSTKNLPGNMINASGYIEDCRLGCDEVERHKGGFGFRVIPEW